MKSIDVDIFQHNIRNRKKKTHTHTHTPPCVFTLKRGLLACNHPTEDTALRTESPNRGCIGAIQPRTSPYTVNRGHALNSIFALFSSSYTSPPPLRRTKDHPQCPAGPRSPVKFHVCPCLTVITHTHPHTHL